MMSTTWQLTRESANAKFCERTQTGAWLCSTCSAVLSDSEVIVCASCQRAAEEKHAREEHARREHARRARIEQAARQGLVGVPTWPHARVDAAEFGSRCRSARLRQFAKQYTPARGSVALLGPSGLGKTTAAVAMVHRLVSEGITAGVAAQGNERPPALTTAAGIVWSSARDIVLARRECELGQRPELLQRCEAATLLVIDEWGSEPDDRDGDLMLVVDERYKASLPTVITTGLTSASFEERYGIARLRRIAEVGLKLEEFGGGQ